MCYTMTMPSHVFLQAARAAPASLPRCPQHAHQNQRTRLKATKVDHSIIPTPENDQQVPLHIARRIQALEQQVQKAYEAGYKAGYTSSVRVQVNVDIDTGSNHDQQQRQQGSGSSKQNLQAQPAAAAAVAAAQGDSIARSFVKGLVWRLFSTTATMGIALLIFHDIIQVGDALKLGALEFTLKFVLYFLHERMWAAMKIL